MLENRTAHILVKSLAIDPLKKHPRDKVTDILFREGETMGPGGHIFVGGLNSGETSPHSLSPLLHRCLPPSIPGPP